MKKPSGREPLSHDQAKATAEFAAIVQKLFNHIEKYERTLENEFQTVYEEWMRAQHSFALLNHRHPKNGDHESPAAKLEP